MRKDLLPEFPLIEKVNYLNTASIGLVPRSVSREMIRFLEVLSGEGTLALDEKSEEEVYDELRRVVAKLLDCSQDEIAVFSSVSEALNSIAWGLKVRDGWVLSTAIAFPSLTYPWIRVGKERGWTVRLIQPNGFLISEEELLSSINEGTKIIALSHVEYLTGQMYDLKAISERAHQAGSIVVVDGIQAAGSVPVRVKKLDVDVYITGSYKWLLGPMGAAVAYISRDLQDRLEPGLVGWRSTENMWDFDATSLRYARTARRFEYSTSAYEAKVGMAKSIEFLLGLGIVSIREHAMTLTESLIEGLDELSWAHVVTPRERHRRGSIVSFSVRDHDPLEIASKLGAAKRKIVISVRKGLLRVSPHVYNDRGDIDSFLDRLREVVK